MILTWPGYKTSKFQQKHFWTNSVHNVSFSGKLTKFAEILFSPNGSVWCVNWWNRTAISVNCYIARGSNTSKSQQNHLCINFAHNVRFPGKLEKISEILFGKNGSVPCVDLWNRIEILVDCHIARG